MQQLERLCADLLFDPQLVTPRCVPIYSTEGELFLIGEVDWFFWTGLIVNL